MIKDLRKIVYSQFLWKFKISLFKFVCYFFILNLVTFFGIFDFFKNIVQEKRGGNKIFLDIKRFDIDVNYQMCDYR